MYFYYQFLQIPPAKLNNLETAFPIPENKISPCLLSAWTCPILLCGFWYCGYEEDLRNVICSVRFCPSFNQNRHFESSQKLLKIKIKCLLCDGPSLSILLGMDIDRSLQKECTFHSPNLQEWTWMDYPGFSSRCNGPSLSIPWGLDIRVELRHKKLFIF